MDVRTLTGADLTAYITEGLNLVNRLDPNARRPWRILRSIELYADRKDDGPVYVFIFNWLWVERRDDRYHGTDYIVRHWYTMRRTRNHGTAGKAIAAGVKRLGRRITSNMTEHENGATTSYWRLLPATEEEMERRAAWIAEYLTATARRDRAIYQLTRKDGEADYLRRP